MLWKYKNFILLGKKKNNNNNKHIKDGQITNKNGSLNVLGSKYLGTNVLEL